jgi:hypothetical protein
VSVSQKIAKIALEVWERGMKTLLLAVFRESMALVATYFST